MLRGDESNFVLSAFGLRAPGAFESGFSHADPAARVSLALRLAEFFDARPLCRRVIRPGALEDRIVAVERAAFTLAVEPASPGPERFLAPSRWEGEPFGCASAVDKPLLRIVCRACQRGGLDLWLRVNHVGADGAPMQEVLTQLESEWGFIEEVRFPDPDPFAPLVVTRPIAGGSAAHEVQFFADFTRLLDWRRAHNARLPEPMTLAAATLWCLARHSALDRLHMGTTVEIAERFGLDRGVGVVVVRPADFFHRPEGLVAYVRAFNRQMERTRLRDATSCRTLDAAARLDPASATALLEHALRESPRAFGQLALTMLKDAKVFGAPLASAGHAFGFIAVGSVALPTADGRRVGCVAVKGPAPLVAAYPAIFRDSIERGPLLPHPAS